MLNILPSKYIILNLHKYSNLTNHEKRYYCNVTLLKIKIIFKAAINIVAFLLECTSKNIDDLQE